jgi:hypothetical protein
VIVSGRVSEFKAPGGLEVKLVTMVNQPAEAMASENMQMLGEEVTVVREGEIGGTEPSSALNQSKVILLKIVMGHHYDLATLKKDVDWLLRYPMFKIVIFVNTKHRFAAYSSSQAMSQILYGEQANRLLGIIAQNNIDDLRDFPGMLRQTLSTRDTGKNALKVLIDQNLEAIPLIDEDEQVKTIVERDQIFSMLLLGLVK